MIEARLRTMISDAELEAKYGKIVTNSDFNLLLTGAATLRTPTGKLLCVYLPGVLAEAFEANPHWYTVFHGLRSFVTDNRGAASGSERLVHGEGKRTRSKRVRSQMIGAFDATGSKQFCRQSSWTTQNRERFATTYGFFQLVARLFERHVPDRYANQLVQAQRTDPNWVIPGTPFTTVTVNNTYPTGVHVDKGDLDDGFSTLAVYRRGVYSGGVLVFPRYRVGIDMHHGDLLLMDAHEHHGNTMLVTTEDDDAAERISIVSYFRTGMVGCGTAEHEYARAVAHAEKGGGR